MRRIALTLAFAATACQGVIGKPSDTPDPTGTTNRPGGRPGDPGGNPGPGPGPGPTDPPVDPCLNAAPNPGASPMRRLTNAEWRYTVGDLLDQPATAAEASRGFTAETESLGFRNNANFLEVPPVLAQQYMDAAEIVAERHARAQVTCDPAQAGCVRDFITSFGARAYRRPLAAAEIARYEALFAQASGDYGADVGIEWIVFTMLQSPHFLHRVELSAPAAGETVVRPSSYEMASRLSYLIWRSMPDQTLFDAAERGELSTPAQIEAQARRMIEDPRARRGTDFYEEWLDVDETEAMQRDTNVFPGLPSDLAALFRQETKQFLENVIWNDGGTFNDLLTAQYTYANEALASHYGLSGVTGDSFTRVSLADGSRAGVLTQGGFIAVHDKPTRTSIVKRGLKIRTDFLCQTIGSPPDDVQLDLPPIDANQTQRDRLAEHRTNPRCAGCHNLIDPIGIVFEQFDAVGRFRTEDEFNRTIDVASELGYTRDSDGPVRDVPDLAQKLAASDQVRSCFATQAFRYAYGRGDALSDACTIQGLKESLDAGNYNLKELMVMLTQTDAFLLRPAPTP